MSDCPFCAPDAARVVEESVHSVTILDTYPVAIGHTLVMPRRHVADLFELDPTEYSAVFEGVRRARDRLIAQHLPDGFNIGINVGAAAGQTVFHAHVHVIPRRQGDHDDPRGGVRAVIPRKAIYEP